MKALKINLNVFALVLGLTLAFSTLAFTNKTEVKQTNETGWFATNAAGQLLVDPYVPIANPATACSEGEAYCAKEYFLVEEGIPGEQTSAEALMRE